MLIRPRRAGIIGRIGLVNRSRKSVAEGSLARGAHPVRRFMKSLPYVRLRDFTWWIWLACAMLLLLGLLVSPIYLLGAIAVASAQAVVFVACTRSIRSFQAQLRVGYALLLIVCYIPPLRPVYWVPTIGTFAMLFVGYCLLSRLLSLLPWNRSEPISLELLRRTFLRAPSLETAIAGKEAAGCPGAVCSLEVQIGRPAISRVQ